MASKYVLMVAEVENATEPDDLSFARGATALQKLENFVRKVKAGSPNVRLGFTHVDDSGTLPAGTITVDTLGGAPAAGETITFPFMTATAVLTVGTDIPSVADDVELADAIAAAINTHPQLGTLYSAVSDGVDEVTITGRFPGALLEATPTTSDATTFTIVAIGTGVAGVDGDAAYFPVGRNFGQSL